jgi:hypothetical protein
MSSGSAEIAVCSVGSHGSVDGFGDLSLEESEGFGGAVSGGEPMTAHLSVRTLFIGALVAFLLALPLYAAFTGNTFLLMVVLIWIQTGFSMTLLSVTSLALGTLLFRAAREAGATAAAPPQAVGPPWRAIFPLARSTAAGRSPQCTVQSPSGSDTRPSSGG